jgi:hypothetical protein
LEEDQTKNAEARIIPIPDVLISMLNQIADKRSIVFDSTNLRKEWYKACVATGVGELTPVEGKPDPSYTGIIINDPRRSAVKNLLSLA